MNGNNGGPANRLVHFLLALLTVAVMVIGVLLQRHLDLIDGRLDVLRDQVLVLKERLPNKS